MSQWIQCNFIQTVPTWADAACNLDTHDGLDPWHQRIEKKAVDELARLYKSSRAKLREDIIFAMDGPAESAVLEAIRPEVTPEDLNVSPDFEPMLAGLLSQTEALRRIARAVLEERARHDDDEEAIMLLIH